MSKDGLVPETDDDIAFEAEIDRAFAALMAEVEEEMLVPLRVNAPRRVM
jgi:hypothetical protein